MALNEGAIAIGCFCRNSFSCVIPFLVGGVEVVGGVGGVVVGGVEVVRGVEGVEVVRGVGGVEVVEVWGVVEPVGVVGGVIEDRRGVELVT